MGFNTKTAIDAYLAQGFELVFLNYGLAIKAPTEAEAIRLMGDSLAIDGIAKLAQTWKLQSIPLFWQGCDRPVPILATQTIDYQPQSPKLPSFDAYIPTHKELATLSDADLSWAIANSRTSACITRVRESKILAANFAVSKTHGKEIDKAIGEEITALWHPDELERLQNFIDRDGYVENIRYWSWRWDWHEEERAWNRVKQNLLGSFWKISYLGVPCRLSVGVHEV